MCKVYTVVFIFVFSCSFLASNAVAAIDDSDEAMLLRVKNSLWTDGIYSNLSDNLEIDSIINELGVEKINNIIPEELYLTINRL